jgi:arylsulfatase A-like enzyme
MKRTLEAGVAGGMLAAAAIGLLEAVGAWAAAHAHGELPGVAWAVVAYGVLGAFAGAGAALAARLLATDAFALAFTATGGALGLVVGRFRVIRDVFLEQAPRGARALLVQLAVGLLVAGAGALLWRRLRGVEARRRRLSRLPVATAAIASLAVVWAGVGAWFGRPAAAPPAVPSRSAPAGKPNLLLVMVDTLRADHLPAYGYGRGRTPAIDALAAGGVRFVNAFAQASWTRPSVATMLSGLYPSSHGAVHKADALPDRVETLAELLRAAGYHTVGFANNVNVTAAFNFDQGYDEYHYLAPSLFFWADEAAAKLALYNVLRLARERFLVRRIWVEHYYQPAEVVTRTVRGWLDRAPLPEPFFLFVHYMDPHDPYFAHPYDGEGYARVANPSPPPGVAERYRQLYDGEISYFDEHLGALFGELRTRELFARTLIVLTADHGEEFHEHGGWWHGTTLYDEQLRVPLIVKPAGPARGARVVDSFATHLDVAPTMLTAAGLPVPPHMQGHPLPLDGGAAVEREQVFAEQDFEGNVLDAVRTRGWKLITANPGNPRGLSGEELFDVTNDPGERYNLAATSPPALGDMQVRLARAAQKAREGAGAAEQGLLDDVTRERLRALGYVD